MSYFRFANNKGLRFTPTGAEAIAFGPTDPPLNGGRLWAGLGGSNDWDRDNLMMNVMRSTRRWVASTSAGWDTGTAAVLAVLDELGYPQSMPPGVTEIVTFFQNAQAPESGEALNGRYRFTYDGVGVFKIEGSAISGLTYVSPGVIEFNYTANGQEGCSQITCTGITAGNHPRNMKLFQTRYAARMDQGFLTRPDFEWSNLGVLRFMDILGTNHHHEMGHAGVGTWAKKDYYTWNVKGAPIEEVIAIANELGIHPWVCIPHTADDAYVTRMATVIRDQLNPALKCYVEWSNETWNFGFQQTSYCVQQAAAQWGGNGTDDAAWFQWSGMRSAQCMDIFSTVFAGQTHRIVRTAGMFLSWEGLQDAFLDAPLSTAGGNAAPHLSFDVYAISGYVGNNLTDDTYRPQLLSAYANGGMQAAINFAINYLNSGASVESSLAFVFARWAYHRQVCNNRGLDLVMYEGGTHIVALGDHINNDTLTAILHAINYSPEMGVIYGALLDQWDTVGDGGFNHFVTISRESRYGSWGAMRWPKDMNPRAIKLLEYNGAPPDVVVPGAFSANQWSLEPTFSGFNLVIDTLPDGSVSSEQVTVIQYRINDGAPVATVDPSASTFGIDAAAGVTVAVQIRAGNSAGFGSWSASKNVTPTPSEEPGPGNPLPMDSRLIATGHSIPNAIIKWPLSGMIQTFGDTANVWAGTGPYATAKYRWENDPAGPDQVRALMQAGGASYDLFLGTEAHGGNYSGRASVQEHITWSDAYGHAALWHNLAASTGAATFYSNFWRNSPGNLFDAAWRDSLDAEAPLWDGIIDHVNANKAAGTPTMRLVPWLEVIAAVYDAIQAGAVTGLTMPSIFTDDVHCDTDVGRWIQMCTVLVVMFRRPASEMSLSVPLQYSGSVTISSNLAAQLRPVITAACSSNPRTGV